MKLTAGVDFSLYIDISTYVERILRPAIFSINIQIMIIATTTSTATTINKNNIHSYYNNYYCRLRPSENSRGWKSLTTTNAIFFYNNNTNDIITVGNSLRDCILAIVEKTNTADNFGVVTKNAGHIRKNPKRLFLTFFFLNKKKGKTLLG